MLRLDEKTALITGASSGLGAHFALQIASQGADVIITARRTERLNILAKTIREKTGQRVCVLGCDINNADSIKKLFDQAEAELATPNIIINNAGIAKNGFLHEISEEDWQQVMDTNLTAVWKVAKTAAKRMIAKKIGGTIINIASILAFRTGMLIAPYAVSKAGVVQLTRSLAIELARHKIRVNALAPGYIPTELNQDYLASESGQKMRARIPLKRFGTLEDLTAPLLLLASDDGGYIVGETICVDGGHLQSPL